MCCSVLKWQCDATVMSDMRVLQSVLLCVEVRCSGSVMQPSCRTRVCYSVCCYVLQCVAVAVNAAVTSDLRMRDMTYM